MMVRPTQGEVTIVAAYLSAGSCKAAASELGIHPDTYRHRVGRIYRRHGVTNMAQLVLVIADDVRPHVAPRTDASLDEDAPVPML